MTIVRARRGGASRVVKSADATRRATPRLCVFELRGASYPVSSARACRIRVSPCALSASASREFLRRRSTGPERARIKRRGDLDDSEKVIEARKLLGKMGRRYRENREIGKDRG